MKCFFRLKQVVMGLSLLSITTLFHMHFYVEKYPARAPSDIVGSRGPPCKVLVSNYKVNFHTEILESLIALVPIDSLLRSSNCDRTNIMFDFIIRDSQGGASWAKYFETEMVHKLYRYKGIRGEHRVAKRIILAHSKEHNDTSLSINYDATVEASCYCNHDFIDNLERNPNTLCAFHEACDQMRNNTRAFWLSPHHERYVFPSVLPTPPNRRRHSNMSLPLDLCVIGSSGRRNFQFLQDFLKSVPRRDMGQWIRINLLGKGDFPSSLRDYKNMTRQESIKDFVDFQHTVATRCNVLLPLLDTKQNGHYFDTLTSKKKLTGTMVQAVAYDIPMVVHEELAKLYHAQHDPAVRWETHTDDPSTFTAALTRLVEVLGNVAIPIKPTSMGRM